MICQLVLLVAALVLASVEQSVRAHVVGPYPNDFTHAPTWEKLECHECTKRWQCVKRPHECMWGKVVGGTARQCDKASGCKCLKRNGSQAPTSSPTKQCGDINFKVPCETNNVGRCLWQVDECVDVPSTQSPTSNALPNCFNTHGKLACCGSKFAAGTSNVCVNPDGQNCHWSFQLPGCY